MAVEATGECVEVAVEATGECVEVAVDEAGQWAELTALALVTTRIKAVESGRPFLARLRTMPLGASQLSELSYGALVSQRTPRLIRQSDPELFQVALIASGRGSSRLATPLWSRPGRWSSTTAPCPSTPTPRTPRPARRRGA